MARPSYFLILFTFLLFSSSTTPVFGDEYSYVKRVDPRKTKTLKEKTSHFRLYWHDLVAGPNITSVSVVKPTKNSSTLFGMINMIDNPLTVGPKLSSKMVGRSEGLYASAGQQDVGLLMVMNFAFSDGKYNGSTLTILGRNNAMAKVREMPIVGGSGLFRFARGFAKANTIDLPSNGNAVVEYNLYVMHY